MALLAALLLLLLEAAEALREAGFFSNVVFLGELALLEEALAFFVVVVFFVPADAGLEEVLDFLDELALPATLPFLKVRPFPWKASSLSAFFVVFSSAVSSSP